VSKKIFFYSAVILLLLNFFAWQEVFSLCGPKFLKVDFLDVGQGDSAFIETPQGHQILIDGGPTSAVLQKLSERIPFWDKTIDLVILTHPESDHMQGLFGVLQRYNVDYVLWTGVKKTAPEYEKWVSVLNQKQNPNTNFLASIFSSETATKVFSVSAGTKIRAGNSEIDVLFPLENLEGQELKASANDTCVVTRLIYGKDSFLFTGDIDSKAEKELANSYELASLESEVLKVAHHGSKYSTANLFLENVKPKIAVISVGKNSYGHPTSEVLQRLEKYDIQTLRTDQSGDINMVSDGNSIKILNNKF